MPASGPPERGPAVTRLGLRTARRDLLALVRAVEQDGQRIVLTRRGRPVAALLPVGALDALDLLARLLPSTEEVAAGLRSQQDEPTATHAPGGRP